MAQLNKADFKIRYELFDKYALKDQEVYYDKTIGRSENASRQVNFIRATLALLTGTASAVAAAVAQSSLNTDFEWVVIMAIIISILLPAIGGFFSSLADLYQWERISTIYDSAKRNLIVADAMSPRDDEAFENYVARFNAYVEGTLQVMSDETAQWGQAIHEPEQTDKFIEQAKQRASQYDGDPDSWRDIGFNDEVTRTSTETGDPDSNPES